MTPSVLIDSSLKAGGRAAPLPPAERREAIITMVLPLLLERGTAVTSRELALAAGVAEGTIFKVFTDKDDLLVSALERAIDTTEFDAALGAIDATASFESRVIAAVELTQQRIVNIWKLFSQVSADTRSTVHRRLPDNHALTALLAAEPGRLRLPAQDCAHHLRALVLALSHPDLVETPSSPAEIVDVFLNGVKDQQ